MWKKKSGCEMIAGNVSKSYAVYRFYRNEFTLLVWGILISVLVVLLLTAMLFSPRIVFEEPARQAENFAISIVAGATDEEELKDSEPLFLPTLWNFRSTHLQSELRTPFLPSFSFGGLRLLENFDERGFSATGGVSVDKIANVFSPEVWGLSDGFGAISVWEKFPAGMPVVRLRVTESVSGRFVTESVLPLQGLSDAKMLLSPVDIICYGSPDVTQMLVVQSCGNADVDKKVLGATKEWAKRNLRSRGVYMIRVGS